MGEGLKKFSPDRFPETRLLFLALVQRRFLSAYVYPNSTSIYKLFTQPLLLAPGFLLTNIYVIVKTKLAGLQCELKNLDVNKVCFAK